MDEQSILTEWQQAHAELTGYLVGNVEHTLKVAALNQANLPPDLVQALDLLAKAHKAYTEHAEAFADQA